MPTSTSTTKSSPDTRLIVGLMGITVVFSVIGAEIKVATTPATGTAGAVTAPSKILLGGVVGTALLSTLAHAGDPGRQFAIGLALVTMATATLVYGGPVWDAGNRIFGSKPTGSTAASTPSTPGSNTTASAATVATNLAG